MHLCVGVGDISSAIISFCFLSLPFFSAFYCALYILHPGLVYRGLPALLFLEAMRVDFDFKRGCEKRLDKRIDNDKIL